MKIYKLQPRQKFRAFEIEGNKNPWTDTDQHDKLWGIVVQAEDETEARKIAQSQALQEEIELEHQHVSEVWLSPIYTYCKEMGIAHTPLRGVVLTDVREIA